jgi:hypothetical protein
LFNNLFSLPAYFVIFSDEFKFTYKTVSFSQTKHLAVAPFPMMLLKASALCGSNPSALLAATMACAKGCSEKFQFQYRLAVLGGWFRLGKHQKRLGIHK